ncbi:MAG TPA: DUF4837 family protein [Cyclobacteriaceae bacterium]|nr:DUF4837 family protein [Cyclobacteriaceae bacterium]
MRTLFIVLIIFVVGCSSDSRDIPYATGVPGDIYLVMDSAQWRGPLGRTLDSIFSAEMPGLPRKESIFKFRWINPRKLNYVLKRSRNLIFAVTLDRNTEGSQVVKKLFTPESIEKIRSGSPQFSMMNDNVFAKNQLIMYLFGKDEKTLLHNIRANRSRLVDYFNQKEKERVSAALFKGGGLKGVSESISKNFQCSINVPFGYKVADQREDFIWLRQINPRDDKDIFIARKRYVSTDDFKQENILMFRNEICAKYLFGDPERSDSYLMTETRFIPVTSDTINLSGKFTVRIRGLFRSNDYMLGGPFVGLTLVDEGTHQLYYIEGFTISPGVDQREIMRELETILLSFKTSKEI